MIQSVWVENPSGIRLDLNLRSSQDDVGLLIFNLEGLGPPAATINGKGGPGFDGIIVNSARTDSRHLVLSLTVSERGEAEEISKALIYEFFPIKQRIVVGITTDAVDVYIPAYVESCEFSQFAKVENATISLLCPNPYYLDKYEKEYVLNDETAIPLFEFPFSNDDLYLPLLLFGEQTTLPSVLVMNPGGVSTGCNLDIYFSGYTHDVSIANGNGQQQMTIDLTSAETYFDGPVEAGDRLSLNTHVGEKRLYFVRDDEWFNVISGIDPDDDWLEIRPGNNLIVITAETGEEFMNTDIRFQPKREGV